MNSEDATAVDEYSDEERRGRRRFLAQQAIQLAVSTRWQEAAEMNQRIVTLVPDDAEAYNRLGKAFTELGRITEAREAYGHALESDAANLIAQRNLDRLSRISEVEASELAKKADRKLDPRFFMEDTGKTGLVTLQDPADEHVLATLTGGDQVNLAEVDGKLVVSAVDETEVGHVEARLAARILRMMQTGNEYQAGIVGVDGTTVRVMIREVRQAPANAGRISFPSQSSAEALPRPYLREGLRRRAVAEDEDEEDVDLDVDADPEEDDEGGEFGFHESTLDET